MKKTNLTKPIYKNYPPLREEVYSAYQTIQYHVVVMAHKCQVIECCRREEFYGRAMGVRPACVPNKFLWCRRRRLRYRRRALSDFTYSSIYAPKYAFLCVECWLMVFLCVGFIRTHTNTYTTHRRSSSHTYNRTSGVCHGTVHPSIHRGGAHHDTREMKPSPCTMYACHHCVYVYNV